MEKQNLGKYLHSYKEDKQTQVIQKSLLLDRSNIGDLKVYRQEVNHSIMIDLSSKWYDGVPKYAEFHE